MHLATRPDSRVSRPQNRSSRTYLPGTLLKFQQGYDLDQYLGAGWSTPEALGRWTEGEVAELNLSFPNSPGDLVLSFGADPLLGGGVIEQHVFATWNGTRIGEWTIREGKTYHCLVFSHLTHSSPDSLLSFHLPDAFSPESRQLSADTRRLALLFRELVLRPVGELGFK